MKKNPTTILCFLCNAKIEIELVVCSFDSVWLNIKIVSACQLISEKRLRIALGLNHVSLYKEGRLNCQPAFTFTLSLRNISQTWAWHTAWVCLASPASNTTAPCVYTNVYHHQAMLKQKNHQQFLLSVWLREELHTRLTTVYSIGLVWWLKKWGYQRGFRKEAAAGVHAMTGSMAVISSVNFCEEKILLQSEKKM